MYMYMYMYILHVSATCVQASSIQNLQPSKCLLQIVGSCKSSPIPLSVTPTVPPLSITTIGWLHVRELHVYTYCTRHWMRYWPLPDTLCHSLHVDSCWYKCCTMHTKIHTHTHTHTYTHIYIHTHTHTHIHTHTYTHIHTWVSFRENEPSLYIYISYKNHSRLNRYNFRTVHAIDFLFSTLHTTPFLYGKIPFGVLHLLHACIATSDTPQGMNPS